MNKGDPIRASPLAARREANFGLWVRRESWQLSWRGRFLALVALLAVALGWCRGVHPFLAINAPVGGQILVVEGWLPSYGLLEATSLFNTGGYQRILTAGGIAPDGWKTVPQYTFADETAKQLRRLGVAEAFVTAVPCRVERKDRTYHSALAVKTWLQQNGAPVVAIDVVTEGTHARRTRLLYQKAFGPSIRVGVIAVETLTYDPAHWWHSSEGVRDVLGESIAYLYARFFTPA